MAGLGNHHLTLRWFFPKFRFKGAEYAMLKMFWWQAIDRTESESQE
jgi:hypothetical protein